MPTKPRMDESSTNTQLDIKRTVQAAVTITPLKSGKGHSGPNACEALVA
jgi:hypothetical protein